MKQCGSMVQLMVRMSYNCKGDDAEVVATSRGSVSG